MVYAIQKISVYLQRLLIQFFRILPNYMQSCFIIVNMF